MWDATWRESAWQTIRQPWDVIIIGGGITGAGVFRAAVGAGLKTLLLEASDFSFGTSSRSSKLVHGGLRYLFNRQFDVTRESVRERQWILRAAPGLVTRLPFVLPNYQRYHIPTLKLGVGMLLYDLYGRTFANRRLSAKQILRAHPNLMPDGLLAGFRYYDASVDDSRLVLRILCEGCAAGGTALNYARVEHLLRDQSGRVRGVAVLDEASAGGRSYEITAGVVVNATGPWGDGLRTQLGLPARLRRLRGSHLVFSRQRFPVSEALTLFHPHDKRAVFVIPWEGVTLVGTTDIDHDPVLDARFPEPFTSRDEFDYLLEATNILLPGLELCAGDVLATFAGLRPVVASGAATPSKESRAHALWQENGLITITGGKLTIFRIMAQQTLAAILKSLGREPDTAKNAAMFDPPPQPDYDGIDADTLVYLCGRYGCQTPALLSAAQSNELERITPLPNVWAELRWAARSEGVQHLDDLLLRRVRLGLLLPEGGRQVLPRVRAIVQPELGWSDARWAAEEQAYWRIWCGAYSASGLPVFEQIKEMQ